MDIKTLIAVATGKIPHNYRSGLCPDELQPASRDPDCPACKILIEAVTAHIDEAIEAREDSARLDFLDENLGMFPIQMGWNVGVAPGGNVSITTVIGGQNNIRESIDFAMQSMKGAK